MPQIALTTYKVADLDYYDLKFIAFMNRIRKIANFAFLVHHLHYDTNHLHYDTNHLHYDTNHLHYDTNHLHYDTNDLH